MSSRFPPEYLRGSRRQRVQAAGTDWEQMARYWHDIAVGRQLVEPSVARSSPTAAQQQAIDAARRAGAEEVRAEVRRELSVAAQPQPPLTPMQLMLKTAKQQDPDEFWDRVLKKNRAQWYPPAQPPFYPATSEPSPPATPAAASSLKQALAAVDADALWAAALERARTGATIR
jgi:hypothetical protein